MTGLARSCRHIASTRKRAVAGSVSARSSSISLPCRTSCTPSKPSECKALPIALPCGSRTPALSLTCTRAFIAGPLLHRARAAQLDRAAVRQYAEAAGDLLIGLLDPAQILAETVLVHLFVG